MRMASLAAIGLSFCCCFAACTAGPQLVQVSGTVTQKGAPVQFPPQTMVQLTFVPVVEAGAAPPQTYAANFKQEDASFTVPGRTGNGIPLGKYRIVFQQHMPNPSPQVQELNRRLTKNNSPLIVEVTGPEPMVIDLDKAAR